MYQVFKYGLLEPTQEQDQIEEQLRLQNKYYNQLIEISRSARRAEHEALSSVPELVACREAIERKKEEIACARKVAADNSVQACERVDQSDLTRGLLRELSELYVELKTAQKLAFALKADEIKLIRKAATLAKNSARKASGVWWGHYIPVEESVDQAIKSTPYWELPSFKPYRGEGRLGVELQNIKQNNVVVERGRSVAAIVGGAESYIQIAPVPDIAFTGSRSERRKASRTTLRMRIGMKGRDPVVAEWPMVYHRPLPANARVKEVSVTRKMVANREVWSLCITVDVPEPVLQSAPERACAVDLGWRTRDEGLRVGYVADSAGGMREFLVNSRIREGLEKADSIRSIRDTLFDETVAVINSYFRDLKEKPAWLEKHAVSHMHQWSSQARLVRLRRDWQTNRIEGDEEVFAKLDAWCRRDGHLWRYEVGRRQHALRYRRECFREFAAELAGANTTLILEDMNLARMAELAPVERVERLGDTARANRVQASPSEFRSVLINAFRSRGGRVVLVNPAYTSVTCFLCGHRNATTSEQRITCEGCKVEWDRDENAAKNLLRAGQCAGAAPQALEQKKPTRTERMRAGRAKSKAKKAKADEGCSQSAA